MTRLIIKNIAILMLMAIATGCSGQQQTQHTGYSIAFYNVENLFDTYDDPKTFDDDFTPKGRNRYSDKIYQAKLRNIAAVLDAFETGASVPAIIGLAEIENDKVLKDLINTPAIKDRGYKYVWYDSRDPRGIDVAMLYDPKVFKVLSSQPLKVYADNHGKKERQRDVLYVKGLLQKDTLHILVNHWHSRREGQTQTEATRIASAEVNRKKVDDILKKNVHAKIIIMGDMNDNPTDESLAKTLAAGGNKDIEKLGFLYNPWMGIHAKGQGTSVYHRQWDLFDNIIISDALLHGKGWQYQSADIFDEDMVKDTNPKYKGYPKRSYSGSYWKNGYSDHFPVLIYLKNVK